MNTCQENKLGYWNNFIRFKFS